MRDALIKFGAASQDADLSTMHALILAKKRFRKIMVYESAANRRQRCSLWPGLVYGLRWGGQYKVLLNKALTSCANQRNRTLTLNLRQIRLWRPSCGYSLLFIQEHSTSTTLDNIGASPTTGLGITGEPRPYKPVASKRATKRSAAHGLNA